MLSISSFLGGTHFISDIQYNHHESQLVFVTITDDPEASQKAGFYWTHDLQNTTSNWKRFFLSKLQMILNQIHIIKLKI